MRDSFLKTAVFLILALSLSSSAFSALLWKDDFSDELMHELTWDTENTTGTPILKDERCIFNRSRGNDNGLVAMATASSQELPSNFDLHGAAEFTRVEKTGGEFYIRIGGKTELIISFNDKNEKEGNLVYVADAVTGEILSQNTGSPATFPHNISNGERCFISWLCKGEKNSPSIIKVGGSPGESNIADFIIENNGVVSGAVEIGVRKGLNELRLNYVRAYLFGTSASLVHDWVLF